MQNAIDLDRRHRGTLQRRQQNPTQCIAQRKAKSTLKRFGDNLRLPFGIGARLDFELAGSDEFLPILMDHVDDLWLLAGRTRRQQTAVA